MKKVGLALGGGGTRGIAHIAYLKAMEELGIRPSVIAGTSSGAIAGSLYAGGMKPDDMYALVQSIFSIRKRTVGSIKRGERTPGGFLSSTVKKYLLKALPKQTFEELEIPLYIVATNFHTLKERVFSSGNIIDAVMASIAYPNVFFPQIVEGEYYVDGGATNIVPFDVLRGECDILVAIDVSAVRPNNLTPGIKNAVHATWAATQEALISLKLRTCTVDLFERPTFDDVATMEFFKYKSIYNRAEESIPDFKQKLIKIIERE